MPTSLFWSFPSTFASAPNLFQSRPIRSASGQAWAGVAVAAAACALAAARWAWDTQRFLAVAVLALAALLEAGAEPLVVACLLRSSRRNDNEYW